MEPFSDGMQLAYVSLTIADWHLTYIQGRGVQDLSRRFVYASESSAGFREVIL